MEVERVSVVSRIGEVLRKRKSGLFSVGVLLSLVILSLLIPPVWAVLIVGLGSPVNEIFLHIYDYLLGEYLKNTLLFGFGTGTVALLLGLLPAWLVTHYDFRGRKFFSWALILPLAIPPFVQGYIYSALLGYQGVLSTLLPPSFHWGEFDVLNIGVAVLLMGVSTYPYLYLIMRGYYSLLSSSIFMAARSLGCTHSQLFWRVGIPCAREMILAGFILILLESFNEFGLVSYFGIPTFSVGISHAWFILNDRATAAKLAALLLLLVLFFLLIKTLTRRREFIGGQRRRVPLSRFPLGAKREIVVVGYFSTILLFAFVLPLVQEFYWLSLSWERIRWNEIADATKITLLLALTTASVLVALNLVVAQCRRFFHPPWFLAYGRFAMLGYAVPGSIIALGLFLSVGWWNEHLSYSLSLNGLWILMIGYLCRFFLLSNQNLEEGFFKMGVEYHWTSRSLGASSLRTFFVIDFPLITPSLLSGFVLIFVEVTKELSLTVNLRPYNYQMLATLAHQYAKDGRLTQSALPSLLIIFLCVPILLGIERLRLQKENDLVG